MHRFGHRSARVTGVVLAAGCRWALVAEVADDGFLDGLTAIRVKGIRRVRPATGFARLVAPTQPGWPPAAPEGLLLDRTRDVLRTLVAEGRLVAVEQERRHRDVMWVGIVDEVADGMLWLVEVRSDGSWHDRPLGYRLRHLTKVSVGTRYLDALASVSPPPHPVQ